MRVAITNSVQNCGIFLFINWATKESWRQRAEHLLSIISVKFFEDTFDILVVNRGHFLFLGLCKTIVNVFSSFCQRLDCVTILLKECIEYLFFLVNLWKHCEASLLQNKITIFVAAKVFFVSLCSLFGETTLLIQYFIQVFNTFLVQFL